MINKIENIDCIEGLKNIPDNSIDCCVTSPPYYGLRDYGHEGQIGLEETPEEYVAKMVEVFTEVKRVLKKEGTLWLNLGDSYAGSGKGSNDYTMEDRGCISQNHHNVGNKTGVFKNRSYKQKDLIGIPWMVAFALRSSGWYLRQDIIWHKPNPMPESVSDRCTKSHEYIFLLSKSGKYYYDADAIKQPLTSSTLERMGQDIDNQKGSGREPGKTNGKMKAVIHGIGKGKKAMEVRGDGGSDVWENINGLANKRSVWTVTTMPYSEAHFATFPERLITDCIKAGCPEFICNKCGKAREKVISRERKSRDQLDKRDPRYRPNKYNGSYGEINGRSDAGYTFTTVTGLTDCGCNAGFSGGIVLDPFMGAGTTALVARKLNRNYTGFELNQEYINIAEKRLRDELGMFL